jgi:protein-S-isoprenylcysteine O-methyltransferase Ste14
MLTAGMTIAVGSPGTWTREVLFADIFHPMSGSSSPGWATWAGWFAAVNFAGQLAMVAGLVARTKTEDAMLKKEFGKQWDEWAKKTPWKLFPGIF